MVIDKELKWTPYRVINKSSLRFTDHYAMVIIFEGIPLKKDNNISRKRPVIWNTNKSGGWKKYFKKTGRGCECFQE